MVNLCGTPALNMTNEECKMATGRGLWCDNLAGSLGTDFARRRFFQRMPAGWFPTGSQCTPLIPGWLKVKTLHT
jgi:hypothetical protein